MPVTYTNRKGKTYTLYRSPTPTRTGKVRYFFALSSAEGVVCDAMPEGYEVTESPNGVVSLARARPKLILPGEIQLVTDLVGKHPQSYRFRVHVAADRIEIHESTTADLEGLLSFLPSIAPGSDKRALREHLGRGARYSPELRFVLADKKKRTFHAERKSYRSSGKDWVPILETGSLAGLAGGIIPLLGTDELFTLF